MKKIFLYFIMALISVVIMSCGGKNNDANAEADAYLESIRKYDQISLKNNETSVDVYVKKGERVRSVYDVDNFFYISFVNQNQPKYNGKYFLDDPSSEIDEKGRLINKSTRFYTVHLNKGEEIIGTYHNAVKTTKRTINIHYIYE